MNESITQPQHETKPAKSRRSTNLNDELNNPCLKEYRMATSCSTNYGSDKDKCQDYFVNYRTCMKFWTQVQVDRRIEGIRPILPPPEEREEIKRKAFNKNRS